MTNNENSDVNTGRTEDDAVVPGVDTDEEDYLRVDDDILIPQPARNATELDLTGPRLMITKLVNENFKSYAGTQVVGPFHKCFSAIVGPNGSGKSNVIDSMLFVFGYRASKIRSKKISVLIHNSSEHPNCTSCSVSVHFQKIIDKPGAEYDVVPDSEFVISRTAFKDNSSYYELNKKKVSFKEIGRLLRSHGVDLTHNRFLILQGEVEQIAMMKPKGQNENDTGMLEFLEDIIGTVRYKEPLEKLFEKVNAISEHRQDKLNRLGIVEKEKSALKKPMEKAVQYLEMENAIIKLEHELYLCKRYNTGKELEEQEKKVAELEKDLAELKEKMKTVTDEKEEKKTELKEKGKVWDKIQQKKDESTTKFDKIRKIDETLHAELVETNKRRKATIAALKTEKTKLEDLEKVPEKNTKDIKECEDLMNKHVAEREKEEAALATLMAGLKEKTAPLLNERSKLEKKLLSLRKDIDQAQSSFDIAKSEFELYTSLEHTEKDKLSQLKESLQTTVETLTERKKQLASLQNKIPASESSLQKAQQELSEVKAQEFELTAKLKKMRISFEEQKSAMQASRSRNKVLDSLMRQKREGKLPGIFGRLGDLGAINGKYDVAISTACGPLDNIVVDTVNTALSCISYLRQNDIGRATFIALEKQQHFWSRCKEKITTPENVPRLFDLIKVEDERVLPAFYYGLQDTLVADNLDQATRIAYGQRRYRVVTLKGELIELSGTMSGGGNTVLKGRMGQKVVGNEPSAVDVENLQTELDTVFQECNRLRTRQQPLENQIHTLSTALTDMKITSEKCKIEVSTLKDQEPSLRKQLQIQEKKASESVSDPKIVQQMEKTVNSAKKQLEKVEEASKSIESEVAHINQGIEEISGSRVKDQQKKISSLTKAIDKARAEICRLQVAIKTAERNVQKAIQKIETLENDVHTCEQRLRDIQKEKQDIEEQGKVLLEEIKEQAEALQERDEALSALKEELDALQARENKMKSVKIDLDVKFKQSNNLLRELQQRVPEYTRRIKALKLQAIPDVPTEELKELAEDELSTLDEDTVMANLQKAKKKLPKEIPNMQIITEYKERHEVYLTRYAEVEEITNRRNKLNDIYNTATRSRNQEFLMGFNIIKDKLKEIYQMITLGGDADLELVDSLDPFSEGVVFSVRPPKKSWKNICNLSGGEKTLSSLALVFALHHYKPTPLYFMDEIDAALDFKNVSIIGNYIKQQTKNAQFIVISLRSNMFELADYLVGIYKTHNGTKSVTVDVEKFCDKAGIALPTIQASQISNSQMQRYTYRNIKSQKQSQNHRPASQAIDQDKEPGASKELCLPELGLCPTPTKNPVQQEDVNSRL